MTSSPKEIRGVRSPERNPRDERSGARSPGTERPDRHRPDERSGRRGHGARLPERDARTGFAEPEVPDEATPSGSPGPRRPAGESGRRLRDARARERVRLDHDTTLIVEAAAGTGKTTAVVSRVVEMIATGWARIEQIAAITFTERAGGELRLRIREGLEARIAERGANGNGKGRTRPDRMETRGAGTRRRDEDAATRERLEAALLHLDDAAFGTIHAFCATILRERPVEAGVDPDFGILAGQEYRAFFERVFVRFVARQLEDPGPGVARLLRRNRHPRRSPIELLREAGLKLLDYRGLRQAWKRKPRDRDAAIAELLGDAEDADAGGSRPATLFEIERLCRRVPPPRPGDKPNWVAFSVAEAADLAREIRVRRSAGREDPEWVEQALASLVIRSYAGASPPEAPDLRSRRDAFRDLLDAFQTEANADLAALLREDLRELVASFEAAKQKAGKLDFEDLLDRTRDLLRRERGARAELSERFRHIVVDEYQDTDPAQTEILLLLTAPEPASGDWKEAVPTPGRLCLVADPKQSIYRFRRADVRHYEGLVARLVDNGAVRVALSTNFRSAPRICEFVNEVMEPVFSRGPDGNPGAQVAYAPLAGHREAMPGPPLAGIEVPHCRNTRDLEQREPGAVADFVKRLLDSDFQVSGRDGERRRVEPRDICLLFRRVRRFGRLLVPGPYAEALRSRDIPHSLQAVESYIGSAEVSFLRAALTAVEFPGDELSVYATLRGPLFSIPDQDLFLFRERGTRLRPSPSPPDPGGDPGAAGITDALRFLFRLHERRNHQPLAVTIQQLLAEKRAETGFLFWKSPQQVLANLRRLTESARAFESGGGLSFRGFVELLATQAEAPDHQGTAHAIDEDVGGVRIMTIHAAKGLEFPVVILCDAAMGRKGRATRIVRSEAGLHACDLGGNLRPWDLIEAEEAEEVEDRAELDRLLYVGMTRARDLLAAPVFELRFGGGGPPALTRLESARRPSRTPPGFAAGAPAPRGVDIPLGRRTRSGGSAAPPPRPTSSGSASGCSARRERPSAGSPPRPDRSSWPTTRPRSGRWRYPATRNGPAAPGSGASSTGCSSGSPSAPGRAGVRRETELAVRELELPEAFAGPASAAVSAALAPPPARGGPARRDAAGVLPGAAAPPHRNGASRNRTRRGIRNRLGARGRGRSRGRLGPGARRQRPGPRRGGSPTSSSGSAPGSPGSSRTSRPTTRERTIPSAGRRSGCATPARSGSTRGRSNGPPARRRSRCSSSCSAVSRQPVDKAPAWESVLAPHRLRDPFRPSRGGRLSPAALRRIGARGDSLHRRSGAERVEAPVGGGPAAVGEEHGTGDVARRRREAGRRRGRRSRRRPPSGRAGSSRCRRGASRGGIRSGR